VLIRIIIGIIVLFALLSVLHRVKAMLDRSERPREIEAKMARCAYCGVYFPRDEGVIGSAGAYCSQAHAEHDGVV
jgi:hypothetical protein